MKYQIFSILILIIFIVSCTELTKYKDTGTEENGLVIKLSNACGWCGGSDSLSITSDLTTYSYVDPCGVADYAEQKTTDINRWNELVDLLDLQAFKRISVNTCYVCVDGCDTWISVKTDGYYHELRFAEFDSLLVQPVQPFIDKLEEIRSGFLNN